MIEVIYTQIEQCLQTVPVQWNGKDVILEMKESDYPHWRQMEWIGFYFQFLCERHLKEIFQFQTPRYDKVSFDGFYEIPFDFKAHAINTSSHQVIVNDSQAISQGIREYGSVGLILALGEVVYNDTNRTFQQWHEELKGGISKYTQERIKRGAWSRLRKQSFTLKQISLIQITDKTLIKCGSFQENFRNSDGRPRRKKVLLDLEKIDEELVKFIEF
ncbi:hypothetical protein FACS189427_07960 [Planctomycetales bacterium]|nr:hypothetical protein FACS189427_07960 [Planctomycetales bacterium]